MLYLITFIIDADAESLQKSITSTQMDKASFDETAANASAQQPSLFSKIFVFTTKLIFHPADDFSNDTVSADDLLINNETETIGEEHSTLPRTSLFDDVDAAPGSENDDGLVLLSSSVHHSSPIEEYFDRFHRRFRNMIEEIGKMNSPIETSAILMGLQVLKRSKF